MNEQNTQANYDWSRSDERVRALGYRSFRAWCLSHGFSPKTCQALKRGEITWGFGPKVLAILNQALTDGLVVEVKNCDVHGVTVAGSQG